MTETTPSIDPSSTREAGRIVNAASFDIEDWFHLVEIESVSDTDRWPDFPTIVEERTDEILRICEEFEAGATFYFLGWIADRYPELVRRTAEAGHEIGTHSYWHRKVP